MTEAAYFNVHGQPLALSAKDAVLAREPLAYSESRKVHLYGRKRPVTEWQIRKTRADGIKRRHDSCIPFGSGASEESAWRAALSHMRISDNEEAER